MNKQIIKRKIKFVTDPLVEYKKNKTFKLATDYATFCEDKIEEKMVLFESYSGKNATGNPYAIYKEMISQDTFSDYTFVWSLNNEEDGTFIKQLNKNNAKLIFVNRTNKNYVKYLATAKYLISDTSFPYYFNKREAQIFVLAWHGTPFKTIGKDILAAAKDSHRNVMKNFLHTDFFVSPSRYTTETILKSQDVDTLFGGTILETGMPRTDVSFQVNVDELKRDMGVPLNKKIILYAPTWDDFNPSADKTVDFMNQINEKIDKSKYFVALKVHYLEYKKVKASGINCFLIDDKYDANEVLAITDHLITDYSSIFFDFLAMNKPVSFYFKNFEEYNEKRGLYLELSDLPGKVSETVDDLIEDIESNSQYKIAQYLEQKNYFAPYDDGEVSKRVVDYVFKNKELPVGEAYKITDDRIKLFFYAGFFKNNGITESFVRLVNHLSPEKYNISLVFPANVKNPDVAHHISRLPSHVKLIFPHGIRVFSLKNRYKQKMFTNRGANGKIDLEYARPFMSRVFSTIVGNTKFDVAIDFSGYSSFYGSMIAYGNANKKIAYLHSDMLKDKERKVGNKRPNYLDLQAMISIYPLFDKLLSVSQTSYLANKEKIGDDMNLVDKMDYIVNYLDSSTLKEKAEDYFEIKLSTKEQNQTIEKTVIVENNLVTSKNKKYEFIGVEKPSDEVINFVTVGRLSAEKNQALLINSFKQVLEYNPNCHLYIIGDGPQKNNLNKLINLLELNENVSMLGHMSNPFIILKKCDIFVLTSKYEGQALVVLEALSLGLKVISTDIPGPDVLLREGYGELVEATEIGLSRKMLNVVNSDKKYKQFNGEAYDLEVIKKFDEIIESEVSHD